MTNQEKARVFISAKNNNDPRCKMLLMMLSLATGISEEQCLARIYFLANGDSV